MPIDRSSAAGVNAVMAMRRSTHGVSGSFMVRADDSGDYWCKVTNNPTSPRIPINEQIAGRLGIAIGVSVATPALVRLDSLAGWEFHPGLHVEPGWAHGCVAVSGAFETRSLGHRNDDDNRRRHAGFYALMDWLAGADQQWLYSGTAHNAYFSHDHGHFFPGGPNWTPAALAAVGTADRTLAVPPDGLDEAEVARLADAIGAISKDEIDAVMSNIPAEWPVGDDELAALSNFLEARQQPVAERLRSLLP
ncbi:MAG TPA: hypothetical protein VF250_13240 [Conexibacter sp.]